MPLKIIPEQRIIVCDRCTKKSDPIGGDYVPFGNYSQVTVKRTTPDGIIIVDYYYCNEHVDPFNRLVLSFNYYG